MRAASSFTRQLLADLLRYPELADLELRLHDIDPERLAVAERHRPAGGERLGAAITLTAHPRPRGPRVDGADFVINMVQIGGIAATRLDLEIPARYGLLQTIGDTTGVGGVFRALRTFPFLSALLTDMQRALPRRPVPELHEPDGDERLVGVRRRPGDPTVGLCHSVYWTVNDLCELIGVPLEGTHYRAAGVNHQAWLLEWSRDGESLYPRLERRSRRTRSCDRRVRVEIYRRIGYYPTETSEHSSEYLSWFLRSTEQIERYRLRAAGVPRDQRAERRRVRGRQGGARRRTPARAAGGCGRVRAPGHPLDRHRHDARDPRQRRQPRPHRQPARRARSIEVPYIVDGDGVHAVPMGALPPQAAALNRSYLNVAGLAIEAMRTGSKELVRQAVLVDPNAASTLTPEQIWALCDDLTAAHGDLMPEALR